MGQNIYTSENIMKYRRSGQSVNVGEWVIRNGYNAIRTAPSPFYIGTNNYCHVLEDELIPNTRYVIDIWIDTDDVIYNGDWVAGGLVLHWSSDAAGTYSYSMAPTHSNGFQHMRYITPADKSLDYVFFYYYTSMPVYFRSDSYIVPYDVEHIYKKG